MISPAVSMVMRLSNCGSMRQFSVRPADGGGWEVREEIDNRPVRTTQYLDWHRVERAIAVLDRRVAALLHDGWVVSHPFHAGR